MGVTKKRKRVVEKIKPMSPMECVLAMSKLMKLMNNQLLILAQSR